MPERGGWGGESQHSTEMGEAMKGTELSCRTLIVKGKAKENVALLLSEDRRPHDKESEKGQSAQLFLCCCWVCLFSLIRPALRSLSILAESGGMMLPTGKGDGGREHFIHWDTDSLWHRGFTQGCCGS